MDADYLIAEQDYDGVILLETNASTGTLVESDQVMVQSFVG
jgi:hypothetical protein